jgi:NitT/TauT family transport system permease protein
MGEKWTLRDYLIAVSFFAALGALWEFGVAWFGIKKYLLPPLSSVLATMWTSRADLWIHSLVTMWAVLLGFIIAVIGGVLIALAVYFVPLAQRTLYPLVAAMQGIPKVALAPLMIVWAGYGLASKVLMAFLIAFFPIVISTIGGLASTPANLLEHFRAIGASPLETFWRLRVPSALPSFVDGCKVAMPLAVIGAIVGEFVGSEKGLGALILLANGAGRIDLVFACLIAVTILSALLYWVIQLLGNRVWWRAF